VSKRIRNMRFAAMSTEKSHIFPGHGMSKKWALPLLLASAAFAVCNAHESAFVRHSPLARRMQGNSDQAPLRRRDSPALATTMKASLKDYRRSLVENKAGKLEKLSRHIFNLQDALLNIDIIQIKAEAAEANVGPPQASPKQTAVVGTGPAGLATAIMLARLNISLFLLSRLLLNRLKAPTTDIDRSVAGATDEDGTISCCTTGCQRRRALILDASATPRYCGVAFVYPSICFELPLVFSVFTTMPSSQ
jgi:hypothetical protein